MVNIPLNIKKNIGYILWSEWKYTSSTILPSSVILFVFLLIMTICPISWDDWRIYQYKLDIDSGDTKSPTGYGYDYGYVLTLDGGALSWKYVKKLLFCNDLLCKHKLFLFSMHYDS